MVYQFSDILCTQTYLPCDLKRFYIMSWYKVCISDYYFDLNVKNLSIDNIVNSDK